MFYDTSFLENDEIKLVLKSTSDANPTKNYVPAYHFDICLLSGEVVGLCDLRIGHNENLYYGGNIGYEVFEEYRGNHFAGKACKLLFELARKHELEYLYITCDPSNIASNKTCLYCDGKFVEEGVLPTYNEMYQEGKRKVNIYRFEI